MAWSFLQLHFWTIRWWRWESLGQSSITTTANYFQVRIDKKINSWSGSIEVGVTQCDPNTLDSPFPSR